MKSRCCTFYRNTSEPPSPGACTFRAQVTSPSPPPLGEQAGGPEGPPQTPRGAASHRPRWTAPLRPEPPPWLPPRLSPFCNAPGFFAAASRLPGRRDEAHVQEALPQAIPSPPRCPGAGASTPPGTHTGRGPASSPPRRTPAARKHAFAFPSRPAHFIVFCLGGRF